MIAPHSLEAEYNVLGAAMLSPKAAEIVCDGLDMLDFYRESNGEVWSAIRVLHDKGEPIDTLTVAEQLRKKGLLDEDLNLRLREVAALTPATANVAHYVKIVRDNSIRRRLLHALRNASEAVMDGRDIEEAAKILESQQFERDEELKPVTLFEALQTFEQEVANPPNLAELGVPAPLGLEPLMPGRVYILAGYQKDGKTAMVPQFTEAATAQGKSVGIASIEMTVRDITDRMIASQGLPYRMVQSRIITPDYRDRYEKILAEVCLWEVTIWDKPTLTVPEIARWQRQNEFDLLIIDHLHRFEFQDRRELEAIMRQIVNLSKTSSIPIVLLAQLKRPFNTDKAPRPTMSMLRESGMIEAEASMVLFVYRKRNEFGLRTSDAELICAANRFGEEFKHDVIFDGDNVRFLPTMSMVL